MYFDEKKIEHVNRLPVRAQIHAIFFCQNTAFLQKHQVFKWFYKVFLCFNLYFFQENILVLSELVWTVHTAPQLLAPKSIGPMVWPSIFPVKGCILLTPSWISSIFATTMEPDVNKWLQITTICYILTVWLYLRTKFIGLTANWTELCVQGM